jgi:CheY-like chemotaxis protein
VNDFFSPPTRSYRAAYQPAVTGDHAAHAGKARRLVLAVDDERDALDFLRLALSDHFDFVAATSGAEALTCIEQRMPDLVIADVMMPGMTGLELCAQLRLRNDTQHIPIILYSAYPMRHSNVGLYDRAFVKPADLDELIDAINNLLPVRN